MWDSTQQTIKENYSIQIVKIISTNILWTEKQPPHLYRQRTKHADFVCVLILCVKKTFGMHGEIKGTFKLTWYCQTGHLTKTVQFNNTEINLCQYPCFITENNNGDIVVSGPCAVVVTDHGGGHRFSYRGHPFGSIFFPRGICTDALSHILVSEKDTVQLIDVDGNFLSYLLIRLPGIFYPYSLSYDVRSHRLCVAAWKHICVYRYITRHDFLSGKAFYAEVNRMNVKLKIRRVIKNGYIIFYVRRESKY